MSKKKIKVKKILVSKVKEIKTKSKGKKEDLEGEIQEVEIENFSRLLSLRRTNSDTTLVQKDMDSKNRIRRDTPLSQEDEEEIHFRPSYEGTTENPYQGQNYSPGTMEQTTPSRAGEGATESSTVRGQDQLLARTPGDTTQERGEHQERREYIGKEKKR
jgi:hypothetical protein